MLEIVSFASQTRVTYEGYPEIKDTKRLGGERESPLCMFYTIPLTVQTSLPEISICFAVQETSGWPEVSRRRRGKKRSRYVVACEGSGDP